MLLEEVFNLKNTFGDNLKYHHRFKDEKLPDTISKKFLKKSESNTAPSYLLRMVLEIPDQNEHSSKDQLTIIDGIKEDNLRKVTIIAS